MPLAVDSQMASQAGAYIAATPTSPWTFSFNNAAGNVLYVAIGSDQTVTISVTYNGVAMTSLGMRSANNNTAGRVQLFRLVNPATGNNTVAVTWSGTSSTTLTGLAISFSGAAAIPDSGTATSADDGGNFTHTAFPLTVTGTTSGNFVIEVAVFGDASYASVSDTLSANTSAHIDNNAFTNNAALQYGTTSGGSKTLTVNGTTATSWATIGIEVKAAPIANVQSVSAENAVGGVSTVAATFVGTPAVGNLITVNVLFFDSTTAAPVMTVDDGNGHSFTVSATDSGSTNMNTAGWIGQAYLLSVPSGCGKTITAHFNKNFSVAAIWIDEFSGGPFVVDMATAFANGTSNPLNGPTVTATGIDVLSAVVCEDGGAGVPSMAPWTTNSGGAHFANNSGYIVNAISNTTLNCTSGGAGTWNALGMSFKLSGAVDSFTLKGAWKIF